MVTVYGFIGLFQALCSSISSSRLVRFFDVEQRNVRRRNVDIKLGRKRRSTFYSIDHRKHRQSRFKHRISIFFCRWIFILFPSSAVVRKRFVGQNWRRHFDRRPSNFRVKVFKSTEPSQTVISFGQKGSSWFWIHQVSKYNNGHYLQLITQFYCFFNSGKW